MKRGSTLFLRFVIYLFSAAVLTLCVVVLPQGIMSDRTGDYRPILIGMYIPAIPFFIGVYQGVKLLDYIDKNKAFSQASVRALRVIKYCGFTISALYAAGMPFIFSVAEQDDAPGVVLIGLIFTFAPLVVAVFASVLQKVLGNAIAIKSENDLTV